MATANNNVSKTKIVAIRAGIFVVKVAAAALIGAAVGTAINALTNKQ